MSRNMFQMPTLHSRCRARCAFEHQRGKAVGQDQSQDRSGNRQRHDRIEYPGIEQALTPARRYLVGDDVTLADICFVAEFTLFSNERPRARSLAEHGLKPILQDGITADYPRAMAHYDRLCGHAAFEPDVGPYLAKLAAKAA